MIINYTNGQIYQWAKKAGGIKSDYTTNVTTDLQGNYIVAGKFYSTSISFGAYILNNTSDSVYHDIFIVKYDSSGNVIWAKREGGIYNDQINSITTDSNGNIFFTGYFNSPSITFGTYTFANPGPGTKLFVVKYNSTGNVIWAKQPPDGYGFGNGVSTDTQGNCIVTGQFFNDSISFGPYTLFNSNAYYDDVFVVKYDMNGNVLWAKQAGGKSSDIGVAISTDSQGNIIVLGRFLSDSIFFAGQTISNVSNLEYGFTYLSDIFCVKYDSNGNILWIKHSGSNGEDIGNDISTDNYGNIIFTGYFRGNSIIFGTDTLLNADTTFTKDFFLVKCDSAGNVLWANRSGFTGDDQGNGVDIDTNGNCIVVGYFNSFSITFGLNNLINNGNTDIFVVKYDSMGNNIWASNVGGSMTDIGIDVSTDFKNKSILTGNFRSSSIFFGTDTLNNSGYEDVFIAKFNECDLSVTVYKTDIFCNGDNDGSITVTPNAGISPFSYLWSNGETNPSITGLDSGFYTITVSDASGCVIVKNTYIYEPPGIYLMWNTTPDSGSGNGTATVIVFGFNSPYTYLWSTGDTTLQVSNLISQYYSITVTDAYGCSVLVDSIYIDIYTDIYNAIYNSSPAIKINPNPSSDGIFYISNIQNKKYNFAVTNILGETIYKSENFNSIIDLSKHSKGIYFIIVNSQDKSLNKKLIIH